MASTKKIFLWGLIPVSTLGIAAGVLTAGVLATLAFTVFNAAVTTFIAGSFLAAAAAVLSPVGIIVIGAILAGVVAAVGVALVATAVLALTSFLAPKPSEGAGVGTLHPYHPTTTVGQFRALLDSSKNPIVNHIYTQGDEDDNPLTWDLNVNVIKGLIEDVPENTALARLDLTGLDLTGPDLTGLKNLCQAAVGQFVEDALYFSNEGDISYATISTTLRNYYNIHNEEDFNLTADQFKGNNPLLELTKVLTYLKDYKTAIEHENDHGVQPTFSTHNAATI